MLNNILLEKYGTNKTIKYFSIMFIIYICGGTTGRVYSTMLVLFILYYLYVMYVVL